MKKCPMCAEEVQDEAVICKHCGYNFETGNAKNNKIYSKNIAGLLALFLGGLGVHKFYIGDNGKGIIYLVFCWTFIPALLGLIDAIRYWTCEDDVTFTKKFIS